MILASHSPQIVRQLCNRAVIIHNGEASEYNDVNLAVEKYTNL